MPKENVDCQSTSGLRVEVGWAPQRYVQIATTNANSGITLDLPNEVNSRTTSSIEPTPFDGWHVDLDREGINRLIRSLRKARDAVYGRDE